MATRRQIEASQRNGRMSRGPSEDGKERKGPAVLTIKMVVPAGKTEARDVVQEHEEVNRDTADRKASGEWVATYLASGAVSKAVKTAMPNSAST